MKIIGSKAEGKRLLDSILEKYPEYDSAEFVAAVHKLILKKKIRFPVLEFIAEQLFILVPLKEQIRLLDKIVALQEIGSYVIAGKLLQIRMERYFLPSLKKAEEYIISGNEWYVCDIIGERVCRKP